MTPQVSLWRRWPHWQRSHWLRWQQCLGLKIMVVLVALICSSGGAGERCPGQFCSWRAQASGENFAVPQENEGEYRGGTIRGRATGGVGKRVRGRLIVVLNSKLYHDQHKGQIRDILGTDLLPNWSIMTKSLGSGTQQKYLSDVVVLELSGSLRTNPQPIVDILQRSSKVRSVTPERRWYRPQPKPQKESAMDRKCNSFTSSRFLQNSSLRESSTSRKPLSRTILEDSKINSRRKLQLWGDTKHVTEAMGAEALWNRGYSGTGIKVAIFDTGLSAHHPHFKNIASRTIWTGEQSADDVVGHGTFVAGVVASTSDQCPGFAPDSELHIFKVFTDEQASFTSWFLDAFNYAIHIGVDILNLSIGGPDFMDIPFVDKVQELTAAGIIMISAIGNDGPLFGTLNNPADQNNVIGVGGMDYTDQIAGFSSRGMSTSELPQGYGRFKPDVVAYGTKVRGSSMSYGCRTLSGTSVASPVVAGAVALLASVIPRKLRSSILNPAAMKQALVESAERLPEKPKAWTIFEQGQGKIGMVPAHNILRTYQPRVSLIPSSIDTADCPYMGSFCDQPIFFSSMPMVANVTIVNGLGVTGYIADEPLWIPETAQDSQMLDVSVSRSAVVWPWVGWLGLKISASAASRTWNGVASGFITFGVTVTSADAVSEHQGFFNISLPIRIRIIATPPRHRRILWDQYHNIGYPPGYFPRDNLRVKSDPLDWNGDHPHTNFRKMFQGLRTRGFFVEVLTEPFTCFDASDYGALLLVDSEEEYFQAEIDKLSMDVRTKGLGLVVIADWYSPAVVQHVRFFDDNTQNWWDAETGGANVPALNDLLKNFSIELDAGVFEGRLRHGDLRSSFSSGTSIRSFPAGGLVASAKLRNVEDEMLFNKFEHTDVVVLGLLNLDLDAGGRVAVFGDSSCLDEAHEDNAKFRCEWLLHGMLDFVIRGMVPPTFEGMLQKLPRAATFGTSKQSAVRPVNTTLKLYSKVLSPTGEARVMPTCLSTAWAYPQQNHAQLSMKWKHAPPVELSDETTTTQSNDEPGVKSGYTSGIPLVPTIAIVLAVVFLISRATRRRRLKRVMWFQ